MAQGFDRIKEQNLEKILGAFFLHAERHGPDVPMKCSEIEALSGLARTVVRYWRDRLVADGILVHRTNKRSHGSHFYSLTPEGKNQCEALGLRVKGVLRIPPPPPPAMPVRKCLYCQGEFQPEHRGQFLHAGCRKGPR